MLTLSDDAADKWLNGNYARSDWINSLADPSRTSEDKKAEDMFDEQWQAGSELYEKLAFEKAQLDLIAGRPLRDAASALSQAHWVMAHWTPLSLSAGSDWFKSFADKFERIQDLRNDLVRQARADIGVDRGSESRFQSAWRRFRARRKLARLKAAYPALLIEPSTRPRGFLATERVTGKRVVLAKSIESMGELLAERKSADERGEPPKFVQEI